MHLHAGLIALMCVCIPGSPGVTLIHVKSLNVNIYLYYTPADKKYKVLDIVIFLKSAWYCDLDLFTPEQFDACITLNIFIIVLNIYIICEIILDD